MNDLTAAERYAEALFELAKPNGEDRAYEDELTAFSAALRGAPETEKFFLNPHVGLPQKREMLERVYPLKRTVSYTLLNFFTILLQKNRFQLVHEIAAHFKKIADTAQGEGRATIRSAVPLKAADAAEMVSRLEKKAGCKLRISKEVDPALIGGVVVKMDYQILDGSVLNEITILKKQLTAARTL